MKVFGLWETDGFLTWKEKKTTPRFIYFYRKPSKGEKRGEEFVLVLAPNLLSRTKNRHKLYNLMVAYLASSYITFITRIAFLNGSCSLELRENLLNFFRILSTLKKTLKIIRNRSETEIKRFDQKSSSPSTYSIRERQNQKLRFNKLPRIKNYDNKWAGGPEFLTESNIQI